MGFKRQNIEELQKQMTEMSKNGAGSNREDDPTEWKPTYNKEQKASAIIRFLPPGEDSRNVTPFIVAYQHGFEDKKTKKWFIHNCPTTVGNDCPVCNANREFWAAGDENTARHQKRKKSFWANILVVKDPANPDANGKIFKYRFGQKIFDKIQSKMTPDDELGVTEPVDVTDPWSGANFVLRAKIVKESNGQTYPNYDECEFQPPSAIGSDDRIGEVASQLHDIQAIIDPDQFESYEKLEKEYNAVKGGSKARNASQRASEDLDDLEDELSKAEKSSGKPSQNTESKAKKDDDFDELDDLLGDDDAVNESSDNDIMDSGDDSVSSGETDEFDELDDLLKD